MNIINIYLQLIPLVLIATIGFWAGNQSFLKRDSIFPLIYYVFAPILVFHNILRAQLFQNTQYISLFGLFLLVTVLIFTITFRILQNQTHQNITAFMFASTNCGYLGLPLIITILGSDYEIYGIICLLAYLLIESVLGFGEYSLKSYLKIPNIQAFLIALPVSMFINAKEILQFEFYSQIINYNRTAYIIFGMLLLGIGMSSIKINPKVILQASMLSLQRAFIWLIVGFGLVLLMYNFKLISKEFYLTVALLSLTPISANTILVSTKKGLDLDYIPTSIVVSTLLAILIIPAGIVIINMLGS